MFKKNKKKELINRIRQEYLTMAYGYKAVAGTMLDEEGKEAVEYITKRDIERFTKLLEQL